MAATKGMKNVFSNLFSKKEEKNDKLKEPEHASGLRKRERAMIARLEAIDLDNPQRRLSDEKIQELNIPGVIKYACSELNYPLITDQDIKNLDDNMDYIIKALEHAIKEGEEMTAEWACTALVFSIRNLRMDIAGLEGDYANDLMACRVEYARNLCRLVEQCREHDHLAANLAEQERRRQQKREELDTAKNRYVARRDSGALDIYLAELEQNIHNPASMSDEAKALKKELSNLQMLKASLIEVDTAIDADQVSLNNRITQIESRRNALSSPPHTHDPKLQERINEANRLYREKLRRELNDAEQALRDHDVHIGAMTELANHSVHVYTVSQALQIAKDIDLERYQHMLAEKQAEELRARAAANVEALKESIREQEREMERTVEYHQVQNTEQETLVEFDFG